MINHFDADDRLIFSGSSCPPGVIPWPFAERSFRTRFFTRRRNLAFDCDLGRGGNRQAGNRPALTLQRVADQPAGNVQLRSASWKFRVRRHEHSRMLAKARDDGTTLSLL